MNALGKRARKSFGGNRFQVKKARKQTRHDKKFKDNVMTPEAYQQTKAQHRNAL